MPPLLKLAALAVSILGLLIALELAALTNKQLKSAPNLLAHNFSNILAFFPAVIHRSTPKLSLALGQSIATQVLDLSWLEKVGPKAASASHLPAIILATEIQQGLIKTYLRLSLLTLALATLFFI